MTVWASNGWFRNLQRFIEAINANDLAFCYQQLDQSVAVSEVQTSARRAAGIVFAADKEEAHVK